MVFFLDSDHCADAAYRQETIPDFITVSVIVALATATTPMMVFRRHTETLLQPSYKRSWRKRKPTYILDIGGAVNGVFCLLDSRGLIQK